MILMSRELLKERNTGFGSVIVNLWKEYTEDYLRVVIIIKLKLQ